MLIKKRELDKALNNKYYNEFRKIFQNVGVNSVIYAIAEKDRFEYFIKKQDLDFIGKVFDFIDNANESEKYQPGGLFEMARGPSNTEHFKLELSVKRSEKTQKNFKSFMVLSQPNKDDLIQRFKTQVIAKVLLRKTNADSKFVTEVCSLVKKHNLDVKTLIKNFGDLALKSDFQEIHNCIFKSQLFSDKELKKEYLSFVFQKTANIENLNHLMKNSESDIREIFFGKIDNNDFWSDFKVRRHRREKGEDHDNNYLFYDDLHRDKTESLDKVIWLEKNHMGFSKTEMPYYITLFKNFNLEEIEDTLKVLNKEKYLTMFNKTIEQYNNLPENSTSIVNEVANKSPDSLTILLKDLNYEIPLEGFDLYDKLSMVTLKLNLEQSLKKNEPVKKSMKI